MHPLHSSILKVISITAAEFDTVLAHFDPVSYRKGESAFQPGDQVLHEYFVVNGCLKLFFLNDDMKMHILQFAMPGWWVSDYKALYNGTKATVALDCIRESELLRLSSEQREKLCAELPGMQYFFRIRTNLGYAALQQRILSLLHNNARQRYEELLALYPQLFQQAPHSLIAAYLGVTRETLSRLYNDQRKKTPHSKL